MKDVEIIFRDRSIIVCKKPAGVACESASGKNTITELVTNALSEAGGASPIYVGLVHRLDQVTSGLMLLSADKRLTGKLSEAIASKEAKKEYLAVVHGRPEAESGEMRDLLFRDSSKNKSYVVKRERRGVREASLEYTLIDTKDSPIGQLSLVKIKLGTGRTHQIRVQFSSRGMSLVGDGKYGALDNAPNVALISHRLSFEHPTSKKPLEFEISPPNEFPWNIFEY